MSFDEDLRMGLAAVEAATHGEALERLKAEVAFAARLARARPAKQAAWERLVLRALKGVEKALSDGGRVDDAVAQAEATMAPLGKAAKEYTIHCVGHGHVDMNWMWDWPETVATTNDTITTVDRLMEEFPAFRFSQSQASVYQILKDYAPELYERVKARVAEGRWEITANQWVEGDKNLASGESICRHFLYTKRFMKGEFGVPYDRVKVDWEPDTFGHAHTVPGILCKAGVRWYYHHRGADGPQLYWWQGKDGSRVLAFDDRRRGYNGRINPEIVNGLLEYEAATGLKDYLFVYGVGDHGGGPTRSDLMMARELDTWPIFPSIALSTAEAFFSAVEAQGEALPVVDAELNFVFEGCYTSQSSIKRANRQSENALVEAEMAALLGRGLAGIPYPGEALYGAWRHALLNQFHDILPGSGIHATYEHAQGLLQEVLAQTTMIKTRCLRTIAGMANTAASAGKMAGASSDEPTVGPGVGGGPGDVGAAGAISRRGGDGPTCDPFVVFNPNPWQRTEVVRARVWEREWADGEIAVSDDGGKVVPAQVVERGPFWAYKFIEVAFPVEGVEGLGYRSYTVGRGEAPEMAGPCRSDGPGVIENEFLRVEVDPASGAIAQLVDKRSGVDLVPAGMKIGLLEYLLEAPHPMTAWVMGQIVKRVPMTEGATVESVHRGPWLAAVRSRHRLNESSFAMTISLTAGVPRVDFSLEVDWLERGGPEIGVPMLKVAFPLDIADGRATFECPNGHVERPTDPKKLASLTTNLFGSYFDYRAAIDAHPADVPAQKWADLTGRHAATGKRVGATLVNDTKYGHSVDGNTMRLTLLRSSYDPDPLPELGRHTIRFGLCPHVGEWSASEATREGHGFNLPLNVVSTTVQKGTLPARKGFAELLTPNVMLSGMKKAEDSDALIVRLYEMEGKATTAKVRLDGSLAAANAAAVETDLTEEPLARSTAKMKEGVLSVRIPAFGLATLKIG